VKSPIFRPAAAADVEDAYQWYENQRPGLGDEFLAAVSTVIESLVTYPERFPIVHRETRRLSLRRFPYSLFFSTELSRIRLLSWLVCMDGGTHDGGNLAING
jgi:plasmid stabilization system protein ParE